MWVQSVKSGSAADKAGIRAGDLITSVENITVVSDGTMKDYCKILREHDPDDQLALRVDPALHRRSPRRSPQRRSPEGHQRQRPPTTAAPPTPTTTGGGGDQSGYAQFVDTSSKLSFEAPASWQYNGNAQSDGLPACPPPRTSRPGPIPGRRRVRRWSSSADQATDPTTLLGDASGNCKTKDDPMDFTNHGYTGKSQQWYQCDGQTQLLERHRPGPGSSQWLDVQVIFTTDADLAAVNRVIDTFAYTA